MATSPTQLPEPNEQQAAALATIEDWYKNRTSSFFVLQGYAGTGKTFVIQHFSNRNKGKMAFTAPTNKAAKVLRDNFASRGERPICRTIHSLLGLQMTADGEIRELTKPEDPVDLGDLKLVIVDEAFMLGSQIFSYIKDTAEKYKVKFLFMGDPKQLPPVKEDKSPVLGLPEGAELTKVMRHDNQILTLATHIREICDNPVPRFNLQSDNDGEQGVWKLGNQDFIRKVKAAAEEGRFQRANESKIIAWRNAQVDSWNWVVRDTLFGADEAAINTWLPTDRVILTGPAKDLVEDEMIASTDDEGRVDRADRLPHPMHSEVECWRLSITTDDNRPLVLWTPTVEGARVAFRESERLAALARTDKKRWKDYWAFKEQFHSVRHAYAITAHRSQGSTYNSCFVDYMDILKNPRRSEGLRCLYVACSRPKHSLYLGGL